MHFWHSNVTDNWFLVICHWSFVTDNWFLVICHWSFVTGHLSLVKGQRTNDQLLIQPTKISSSG
uniref:Uncharacterized protein n=1 Tax=Planktothricoides sp. SpSt-374 TaxID=2282167 RepID=A0A7C3ZVB1_9CYAN